MARSSDQDSYHTTVLPARLHCFIFQYEFVISTFGYQSVILTLGPLDSATIPPSTARSSTPSNDLTDTLPLEDGRQHTTYRTVHHRLSLTNCPCLPSHYPPIQASTLRLLTVFLDPITAMALLFRPSLLRPLDFCPQHLCPHPSHFRYNCHHQGCLCHLCLVASLAPT